MSDRLDKIADDITDLKVSMATLTESLKSYPDMKTDVDDLKSFNRFVKGVLWVLGLGGGGTGAGWITGLFDAASKGQTGTH